MYHLELLLSVYKICKRLCLLTLQYNCKQRTDFVPFIHLLLLSWPRKPCFGLVDLCQTFNGHWCSLYYKLRDCNCKLVSVVIINCVQFLFTFSGRLVLVLFGVSAFLGFIGLYTNHYLKMGPPTVSIHSEKY